MADRGDKVRDETEAARIDIVAPMHEIISAAATKTVDLRKQRLAILDEIAPLVRRMAELDQQISEIEGPAVARAKRALWVVDEIMGGRGFVPGIR